MFRRSRNGWVRLYDIGKTQTLDAEEELPWHALCCLCIIVISFHSGASSSPEAHSGKIEWCTGSHLDLTGQEKSRGSLKHRQNEITWHKQWRGSAKRLLIIIQWYPRGRSFSHLPYFFAVFLLSFWRDHCMHAVKQSKTQSLDLGHRFDRDAVFFSFFDCISITVTPEHLV